MGLFQEADFFGLTNLRHILEQSLSYIEQKRESEQAQKSQHRKALYTELSNVITNSLVQNLLQTEKVHRPRDQPPFQYTQLSRECFETDADF